MEEVRMEVEVLALGEVLAAEVSASMAPVVSSTTEAVAITVAVPTITIKVGLGIAHMDTVEAMDLVTIKAEAMALEAGTAMVVIQGSQPGKVSTLGMANSNLDTAAVVVDSPAVVGSRASHLDEAVARGTRAGASSMSAL